MSEARKKKTSLKGVILVITAILIPVMLIVLGSEFFSTGSAYRTAELEDGWDIYYRGRITRSAAIDDFDADGVVEGERAAFEILMPDMELFAPCVTFKTRLARVRAFLDEEQIYSYGYDIPDGGFVPKAYHYIQLPTRFAGKTLRIEISAAQDSAFTGAYAVTLGNAEDLMRGHVQSRRMSMLAGIFMFYFGLVLAVLSPFLILGTAKDHSVLFSAAISVVLGLYILSYNDAMSYFIHNDVLSHELEYIALFLAPPAVIAYVLTGGSAGVRRKNLLGLFVFDMAFVVLAVVFHYTGFLALNHFLTPFHLILLVESVYLLYVLLMSEKEARKTSGSNTMSMSSERVLLMGILFFVFAVFLEMLRYYIARYFLGGKRNAGVDFVTVGALAIVLSIMLNYFFHSVDHLTEARTRIKLYGMAYTDALTGLDNRASCDQFMASLTSAGQDYAVVSIDLDGLKVVNDKQGHSIGDMMISGFGGLMKDAFSDCELVGRMGGDEFLVIKKGASASDMEADIRSLKLGTEEENRRGNTFKYAFSYGVADSGDGADIQAVYMLADERMYSMKEEHHRQRGMIGVRPQTAQGEAANAS